MVLRTCDGGTLAKDTTRSSIQRKPPSSCAICGCGLPAACVMYRMMVTGSGGLSSSDRPNTVCASFKAWVMSVLFVALLTALVTRSLASSSVKYPSMGGSSPEGCCVSSRGTGCAAGVVVGAVAPGIGAAVYSAKRRARLGRAISFDARVAALFLLIFGDRAIR